MDSILSDNRFSKIAPIFMDRINRLEVYRKYYNGTVYFDRPEVRAWKLYAGIKMFYNLISRAVDMDAHLIPNKFTLVDDTDTKVVQMVEQIETWSNWKAEEFLYVHYGALYGDSYLKVIDKPDKVMVKPLDPRYVWLEDDYALLLYYDLYGSETAEYITPDRVTIYKDAKQVDSFENMQGVIPVVHVQHKDIGSVFGANTFHNILPQLNVINEITSILEDAVLRNIDPILVITGAQPSEFEKNASKAAFLPEGATVSVVKPDVAINQVLEFIKDVKQEAKDGLPELAFDDLRAKERLAAETLEVQLKELAVKILRSRANYDLGYETAFEMAFKAAINRGLRMEDIKNKPGFEVAKVKVNFDRPTIPLSIREELSIELIQAQKMATLANVNNPPTQALNGEINDRAGNTDAGNS